MLAAWRIVKSRHASTAFDGKGARAVGGRWNSPGVAVVYASESRALAVLEVLAGLRSTAHLDAYVLIGVRFDESFVATVDPADLPTDWNAYPPPSTVQAIGDSWAAAAASAVLAVPSVLVPDERKYLINPAHPAFAGIEIGEAERIPIDPRLVGRSV